MAKRDARNLDHKTLEEIRIRAVEQVQSGESPEGVIRRVSRSQLKVGTAVARFR